MMTIARLGIDLAKHVFQPYGVDGCRGRNRVRSSHNSASVLFGWKPAAAPTTGARTDEAGP